MAITDLTGLWVECLSALARGMAGTVAGAVMAAVGVAAVGVVAVMAAVAMVEEVTVATVSSADAGMQVAADTRADAAMLGDVDLRMVVGAAASTVAEAASMVAEVDSTEVAVTVGAVDMVAADTDKLVRGLI